MKHLFFFLLLLSALFVACSKSGQQESATASVAVDFTKLDTALSFAGYWLSESYFNDINTHRSPQKSQEGSEDCFVVIPERTLQPTMMVWNFHEGSEEITVVKKGPQYQLYEFRAAGPGSYQKDITVISADKLKIGDKTFVKITPYAKPNEKSSPLILEEILFKGKYRSADGKEVEFRNDGRIIGLDNYHYYQPTMDYIGPGMQIDQISLSAAEEQKQWMAFKFRQDTLLIYDIRCIEFDKANNECSLADFGTLKHTLIRKK